MEQASCASFIQAPPGIVFADVVSTKPRDVTESAWEGGGDGEKWTCPLSGRKGKVFDGTDCLRGREGFWSAVQSSPLMHTRFDISVFCLKRQVVGLGPA